MQLVVENENEVMSLEGEVVHHVDKDNCFGVRFVNLTGKRREFLEGLVRELVKQSDEWAKTDTGTFYLMRKKGDSKPK